MKNSTNQPLSTSHDDEVRLPFEIVYQIIEMFYSELETFRYEHGKNSASDRCLTNQSDKELFKLLLVSKTWSRATIPIALHTVQIHGPKCLNFFFKTLKSSIYAPGNRSLVKHMIIRNLAYLEHRYQEDLEKGQYTKLISTDQAASLIELVDENLKELKLVFFDSFGISSNLIKAIHHIKGLKKLNLVVEQTSGRLIGGISQSTYVADLLDGIPNLESLTIEGINITRWEKLKSPALSKLQYFNFSRGRERRKFYDSDSLIDFLEAIPNLKYLTLEGIDLTCLECEAPGLSNLRYFNFHSRDYDLDAIAHLCSTANKTLKVVECASQLQISDAEFTFGPIKDTLEGLFTRSVICDNPTSAINMNFPRLRVFSSRHRQPTGKGTNLFLTWSIFRAIRTLALDIDYGQSYLKQHLKYADGHPFCTTPSLRHILFILNDREDSGTSVCYGLTEKLASYGIKCHVLPESKPDELMELDLKLNGPIE